MRPSVSLWAYETALNGAPAGLGFALSQGEDSIPLEVGIVVTLPLMRSYILRALIVFSILLLAWPVLAIELYVWTTKPGVLPIVLPVKQSESPQQAAERYVRALRDPELAEVFSNGQPELPLTKFERLTDVADGGAKHRALLISNDQKDFLPNSERIETFAKVFAMPPTHMSSYLMPMVADSGLSEKEFIEFTEKAREHLRFVVAMGGPDVHPHLHNSPLTHSIAVNLKRDRFEYRFLRAMVQDTIQANWSFVHKYFPKPPTIATSKSTSRFADPTVVGICHGEQMVATVLGYRLVQDIPTEVPNYIEHQKGALHDIEVLPTESGWLESVLRKARALRNGGSTSVVNTYHHQHVVYEAGGPLELAARAPDGVTEALESRDRRLLLLQFHPELFFRTKDAHFQSVGEALLISAAQQSRQNDARARAVRTRRTVDSKSCRAVFN